MASSVHRCPCSILCSTPPLLYLGLLGRGLGLGLLWLLIKRLLLGQLLLGHLPLGLLLQRFGGVAQLLFLARLALRVTGSRLHRAGNGA